MSYSPSNIILHLLSKNGPQTSRQLLSHIKEFPQLKSHTYLKSKVLTNMKNNQLIEKKISNDPNLTKLSNNKTLFLWFINETKVNKDAHMKLYSKSGDSKDVDDENVHASSNLERNLRSGGGLNDVL